MELLAQLVPRHSGDGRAQLDTVDVAAVVQLMERASEEAANAHEADGTKPPEVCFRPCLPHPPTHPSASC
jgi:hypothetical protein